MIKKDDARAKRFHWCSSESFRNSASCRLQKNFKQMKAIVQNMVFRAYALLALLLLGFSFLLPLFSKKGGNGFENLFIQLDRPILLSETIMYYFAFVLISSAIGIFVSFLRSKEQNMIAFSAVFGLHLVIIVLAFLTGTLSF